MAREDRNEDLLFIRYQDYQPDVGWFADDEDSVGAAARVLGPHRQALIDDCDAEIGCGRTMEDP